MKASLLGNFVLQVHSSMQDFQLTLNSGLSHRSNISVFRTNAIHFRSLMVVDPLDELPYGLLWLYLKT